MARILIVDDEPDIATLVRMTLESEGHQVTVAPDGAAALDLVSAGDHDAMVLDVTMPDMDGYEVLSRIKADADPSVSSLPVLFLTARTGDLDRIRGGIEGALHYVNKPFDPARLRAVVAEVIAAGKEEPDQRRVAQRTALEALARIEKGDGVTSPGARPHLTRLDRPPDRPAPPSAGPAIDPAAVAALSDKQRELLVAVRDTPTVQEAAANLGVSRSNVYASLRRIARRLRVTSVPELVTLTRHGAVPDSAL